MAEGELAEIIVVPKTFLEKLVFYTTAFFILLGTFSLFAFLFLVPFVIDPAFTTIFMQFEPVPALCVTIDTSSFRGASNCSWASCREGCTREVYDCTQIRVNYKILPNETQQADEGNDARRRKRRRRREASHEGMAGMGGMGGMGHSLPRPQRLRTVGPVARGRRWASRRSEDWWMTPRQRWSGDERDHQPLVPRGEEPEDYPPLAAVDEDLEEEARGLHDLDESLDGALLSLDDSLDGPTTGLQGNDSEWYFVGARLHPNVKGCGYPPMLNCSVFLKKYREIGTNFSCYYSKIDPGLVIDKLDMWQVYMNLVYAMAIPIPSFIISVIYLTIAYFKIYAEDEDAANATGVENTPLPGASPLPGATSGGITPISDVFRDDMASFGHQLKVAMVDEMSRDSMMDACIVTSNSMGNCTVGTPHGNLSRTMTTSITTPPGPIADL